jgi:3-hydroxyisobutyrate dehydrogenase-like beta-hydroxyacid dehydrogenase
MPEHSGVAARRDAPQSVLTSAATSAPRRLPLAQTPAEVAKRCDITFAMLSDPPAAIQVAMGPEGVVKGTRPAAPLLVRGRRRCGADWCLDRHPAPA